MFHFSLPRLIALISLLLLVQHSKADTSTTIVSVTSTTTVHVTATDYAGACENFVGACVVYGTYASAPYTTTVYRYAPSPPTPPPPPTNTVVTSTRVILATTTVSNEGACSNFRGACVVYGSNTAGGQATKTVVYYDGRSSTLGYVIGSSATPTRPGNAAGYIGPKIEEGDGAIGNAAGINRWTWITVLGAAVGCAVLML